eukprot:3947669-Amphidinium_carterae.1
MGVWEWKLGGLLGVLKPGTRRGRTSQNGPSSEEDALCPTRSCIVTAFQPLWLPYREVASQPERRNFQRPGEHEVLRAASCQATVCSQPKSGRAEEL